MTSSQFQPELSHIAELLWSAGQELLKIYSSKFKVSSKFVGELVTDGDRLINEMLVNGLHKLFPKDVIVAEESANDPAASSQDRVWFVDPLDGTNGFVSQNGEFSIMIGLAIEGRPVLGGIYQPLDNVLLLGVSGQESLHISQGTKRKLRVSQENNPQELRIALSRFHRTPLLNSLIDGLGISKEITTGSVGLKIGLIADQRADIYLEPSGNTKVWDACAPQAVLSGAGGRITDLLGGPLLYDPAQPKHTKGILATNGACHAWSVEKLTPLVEALY